MYLACRTHPRGSGIRPSSGGVTRIFAHRICGKSPTVIIASNSRESVVVGSARRVTVDDLRFNVVNEFTHEEPRLTLHSVAPFEVDLLKTSLIEIHVRLV